MGNRKDSKPYFLGIDGGTESLRVGIFDRKGKRVTTGQQTYTTYHPNSGWAEQAPEEWEEALYTASKEAISSSEVQPEEIAAIAADATIATVVPVDESGDNLSRAILWMDVRAQEEYQKLLELEHESLKKFPTAEWAPCKLLWLKNQRPKLFSEAHSYLEFIDWINMKLTGSLSHAQANLSARWFYDPAEGGLPTSLYQNLGISEITDKLTGPVVPPGKKIGRLQQEPAEKMGLKIGIPVIEGVADALSAVFGTNTLDPGELMMIMGSSHVLTIPTEVKKYIDGLMGPFPGLPLSDSFIYEAGQTTTGAILDWFRDFLGEQDASNFYEIMDRKASEVEIGSEGLVLTDHFQGNRTPLRDPSKRGKLLGLSLNYKREHLYRAILEGVAYGTEMILDVLRDNSIAIDRCVACGGGATSDFWLQIHSDVSDLEIEVPEEKDASLLGCGVLAAGGSDVYSDIPTAANQMVHMTETIHPKPKNTEKYRSSYLKYRNASNWSPSDYTGGG